MRGRSQERRGGVRGRGEESGEGGGVRKKRRGRDQEIRGGVRGEGRSQEEEEEGMS